MAGEICLLTCILPIAWKRVPSYIAGQLLGFIGGSGVAYGLYRHAITIYEGGPDVRTIGVGGTANFFATYPSKRGLPSDLRHS